MQEVKELMVTVTKYLVPIVGATRLCVTVDPSMESRNTAVMPPRRPDQIYQTMTTPVGLDDASRILLAEDPISHHLTCLAA